jgi:hypothetical protein
MRDIRMSLALFTFFNVIGCVFLHSQPEVARSQRFSGQGFGPNMMSTAALMYLGQYIPDFFWANAFLERG